MQKKDQSVNNKISWISISIFLWLIIMQYNTFSQALGTGYEKFLGSVYGNSGVPSHFLNYWNQVTPENAGKWGSVETGQDKYNWGGLDNAYNYAKNNNLPYRHHTLVWGEQQPGWLAGLSQQEQKEEVEEWISLIGERYPDIDYVDVVNEPLPGRAVQSYREAIGGSGSTGWDWIIWSFEKARQYLPHAELHINEYNILNSNSSTSQYIQIINLLKERNLIDGIGIQGHRFELENTSVTTIKNNLDRLAATGLPIYITEFDLGNNENSGTPNDDQQLATYKRVFPTLWEHPAVKGITFWGYVQNQMWQSTCYLVKSDGSERPALQWLRKYLTTPGDFKSYKSGDWNDPATWTKFDYTDWVYPPTSSPSLTDNIITIQSGHVITFTESDTLDQVIILSGGTLQINEGVTLYIRDGNGTDLLVSGTIKNFGKLESAETATIKFGNSGKYIHFQDAGTIPDAEWGMGSICQIEGIKTTAPANGNQNFHHVVWNCPDQAGNLSMKWNGITIGGNITVISTGTGRWQMCAPSADTEVSIIIKGNINQSGGQFTSNGTGNSGTVINIIHEGNINVSGGNFAVSRGSQGGTGTTTWNLSKGNISISNSTTQNSNASGAKFFLNGLNTTQSLSLTNVTYGGGGLPIEVDSGAVLDMGQSILKGNGSFRLNDGATLQTAHPAGLDSSISNSGNKFISSLGNFVFNGSSSQVTGELMPVDINDLQINNSSGMTISNDVVVHGVLELKKGSIALASHKLSYGENGTLRYSALSAQTTSDIEFPESGGPYNLSINCTGSVTLHAPRKIEGNLDVSRKFKIGENSFTASSTSNFNSANYIIIEGQGKFYLSNVGIDTAFFPVGLSTGYAPVSIINKGTEDIIGVNVEADKTPAAYGPRVNVKWNISEEVENDGNYEIQFGWMDWLEGKGFRTERESSSKIFDLSDTTEAGSGDYKTQFDNLPYSVARTGITKLGSFAVGKFSDVGTDVIQTEETIPNQFSLHQNFPNPFNPSTNIGFILPEQSHVKLVVYDVLGNEIITLVDEKLSAGNYTKKWNAVNNASGIYIYKLISGSNVLTRKMILIK